MTEEDETMKLHINARVCMVIYLLFILAAADKIISAQDAAYTDGKAALLAASNIKKLAALNAAIALPTYIPAGYKFKKIWIQKPEAHIIAFSITYENAAGETFTIQSNNEALGDMAVKREVKGESKYFRDSAQEAGEFYTGPDQNDAKTVASEWLCSTKKYQPKSSISQCFQLLSETRSVSPAEAMKIVSSLRYLKR